jgi:tryptophan halogenase
MNSAPRHVAVVGGGSIAWIAALGLRRAFRHLDLDVTVLDTGPETGAPPGWWTLPSQRGAHAQLGVGELEFLRATGATFKLATEHAGWQGANSRFMHAHGDIGQPIGIVPFYKRLLLEARRGRLERAENYSIASLAAKQGRFAQPVGGAQDLTSGFAYGFHVDERALADFLRGAAQKGGVRRIAGAFSGVKPAADGFVQSLLFEGGAIEADFFLDCTGADALLMHELGDQTRVDWHRWFPNDRALAGYAPAEADPAPLTRTRAGDAGWSWRAPVMAATLAGSFHSSAFTSDDAAHEQLQQLSPGIRDATLTKLNPGRREYFWKGNCLALGAAAVELEPLAGASLHLSQLGLAQFVELFPLGRGDAESVEYNRQMAAYADSLRDFTLAHYRLGARCEGEFWKAVDAEPLPESLALKLDLYRASGRITIHDNEIFEETDWAWLLMGAGEVPQALETAVESVVAEHPYEQVDVLSVQIERLVSTMPRHGDYLRRLHSAPRKP